MYSIIDMLKINWKKITHRQGNGLFFSLLPLSYLVFNNCLLALSTLSGSFVSYFYLFHCPPWIPLGLNLLFLTLCSSLFVFSFFLLHFRLHSKYSIFPLQSLLPSSVFVRTKFVVFTMIWHFKVKHLERPLWHQRERRCC